jgi:hypothetical protein
MRVLSRGVLVAVGALTLSACSTPSAAPTTRPTTTSTTNAGSSRTASSFVTKTVWVPARGHRRHGPTITTTTTVSSPTVNSYLTNTVLGAGVFRGAPPSWLATFMPLLEPCTNLAGQVVAVFPDGQVVAIAP